MSDFSIGKIPQDRKFSIEMRFQATWRLCVYEPSNLKAHFADYVVLECLDFDSFPIAVSTDDSPECLVFKKVV
jgi:hypothetical protein